MYLVVYLNFTVFTNFTNFAVYIFLSIYLKIINSFIVCFSILVGVKCFWNGEIEVSRKQYRRVPILYNYGNII